MKRRLGSYFYHPKASRDEIARKRWNIPAMIGKIIKRACMTIGALVLFTMVMGFVAGAFIGKKTTTTHIPSEMFLYYNLSEGVGESHVPSSFSDPLALSAPTVHEVVDALDTAANDKRVKGFVVNMSDAGIELSHIQELRVAIARFRASGKFAYIYTSSFSDLGSGVGAYYFASAFEQIWMQPVGFLLFSGLSIDMPFARDLLNKVGANPEFLHREDYKSAMESFTNSSMSPANREMMQSILDDFSGQIMRDIAKDRKMSTAILKTHLDKGILSGDAALKAGLITHLDYADVMVDAISESITGGKDGEEPPLMMIEDYYDAVVKKSAPTSMGEVVLVNIVGEIVPGMEYEPGYATGEYIAGAIHDAADDAGVKVIVLRVDSPGGSPTASETIRRAVVYAKEKGKKIVVSMGPTAASGGYWVSVDADKIFAMPATLTGSIGVIMGKFELSGLWNKMGVNWEGMSWGQNASLWSMNKPMSESERSALNAAIDDTYGAFVTRVAKGRKMDEGQARDIAKGRAWTGLQAKENGLVDAIGGLDNALDESAKLVGKESRKDIAITILPKPLTPIEQFMMLLGGQVRSAGLNLSILPDGLVRLMRQMETVDRSGPIQTYDPSTNYMH